MPRLSVWLVRTALVQLVIGAALGALYLGWKGFGVPAFAPSLLPLHVECVLVGWVIQLVLGVAYWILPRRADERTGPGDGAIWLAYVLVNGGVVAVGVAPLLGAPSSVALAGRVAELAAAAAFATHAWPRVRPYGAGRARAAGA